MGYFSQVYRDLPPMTAWEDLSSYLELLADMWFVRAPVFPRFGLLYCKRNSGRSFCGAGRTVVERDTTVRQSASAASAMPTLTPFQMGSFRRWSRIFGTFCGEVSLLTASSLYPKGGTRISRTSKLDTIVPCPGWQVRIAIPRFGPRLRAGRWSRGFQAGTRTFAFGHTRLRSLCAGCKCREQPAA